MAPRTKITKEEIIQAAVKLVREKGEATLNARSIAAALGCSTQPIFSNFENMEALRAAIIKEAEACYIGYIDAEMRAGKYPPYKASGMAYIHFAAKEQELFRLLFMRDRRAEAAYDDVLGERIGLLVRESTGLDPKGTPLFHLEMWSMVHGIAVMTATGYFLPEEELISRMLTDGFNGLKGRFEK